MKIFFVSFLWLLILVSACSARDFQVEFMEENYRETQKEFSYQPLIYHSFQVNSNVGTKLLILTGEDYNYRKWLRHYISQNKKLIIKIPDDRVDAFISAKAYEIDIKEIHPFNGDKWMDEDIRSSVGMEGDNHIMVVDPDEKRVRLVQSVIERMSYRAAVFNNTPAALEVFKSQPENSKW